MFIFSYLRRGLRMPRAFYWALRMYQMRLYVAHSQSFQLYQMTHVERQKFDEEEDEINLRSKLLRTLSKAASKGNFASDAMLDP